MSRPTWTGFALSRMHLQPVRAPLDDMALAQRCAAGDEAAQRLFFERESVQVHRTLYRVLGSNRQMEDLIQETFIEAYNAIGSFRGASSLHTWIDTIAARVVYRHLARKALPTAPLTALAQEPAPSTDPERQLGARRALHQLYAMLDGIEPKYRIAYTLHVIDGRPLQEVAQVSRCTVMAVKNRIWRARRLVQARAERDPVLREFITALRPTP